jgi:hypothetical protein
MTLKRQTIANLDQIEQSRVFAGAQSLISACDDCTWIITSITVSRDTYIICDDHGIPVIYPGDDENK